MTEAEHPQRRELNNELHARPFIQLEAPAEVLHLALLHDGQGEVGELAALLAAFGTTATPIRNHWTGTLGPIRLKWERHTEFTTYSFFGDPMDAPFTGGPLAHLPPEWRDSVAPRLLAAARIALVPGPVPADPEGMLGGAPRAGGAVMGGVARVWTDFRIDAEGFSRFLVVDTGMRDRQAGRLVQRLLEIETYSMMALLGLPVARAAMASMAGASGEIAAITTAMVADTRTESHRGLLQRLLGTAAEIERLAVADDRLRATAAYDRLVRDRLAELREDRLEGLPTVAEFLDRRFSPAMATCRAATLRQDALSQRIARTSNLLRTHVDIGLEDQNRALLESMDRRAQMQLRLQETVEGLSVVAISYYGVGLLEHALRAFEFAPFPLPVEGIAGLATPVVVAAVFLGARRLRHRMRKADIEPDI